MPGDPSNTGAARDEDAAGGEGASEKAASVPPPQDPQSGTADMDPLAQAQADAARMKDAWLRTAADFDNFRKRARKELEDARRGGREDLLRAVLPVFDNLERAIQSAQRTPDVKAVSDGLSMVQRQFVESLAREGIVRVPTVGRAFDPSVHEAIQQVETSDHEPGTVLAEVQPGYTQGERLVRAAMVVVAKGKAGESADDSDESAS